jgi:hypothetical protein
VVVGGGAPKKYEPSRARDRGLRKEPQRHLLATTLWKVAKQQKDRYVCTQTCIDTLEEEMAIRYRKAQLYQREHGGGLTVKPQKTHTVSDVRGAKQQQKSDQPCS